MSTKRPEIVSSENLSLAWGQALLSMLNEANDKHAPLVISVTDFDKHQLPVEDPAIRAAVDAALLATKKMYPAKKTALTIFPNDLWEFKKQPKHEKFAELFRERWFPAIHRTDSHNRRGTYFQRMVAHGADFKSHHLVKPYTDQLAHIIKFCSHKGGHRRSALQAAIFDPAKDHTNSALSPFPCLQQVSFSYDSSDGLSITGYYPTEYIFDRGYGNYLGLCHLGRYMAAQLERKLTRMNCVISHPMLGGISKGRLKALRTVVEQRLTVTKPVEAGS